MAGEVFRRVDPAITFTPLVADGDVVAAMTPIATVEGPARNLLAGERVALNLLQHLSGVATVTALRRRGARLEGAHRGHSQDHTGAARAGEGGGTSRRRTNRRWADRWRADQGQPPGGGRRCDRIACAVALARQGRRTPCVSRSK